MQVGAVLPQTDLGTDVTVIRSLVARIASLGYEHLRIADHVVGFDLGSLGLPGPYSIEDAFHEPLVLMGFLAASCDLELATTVLVTPQRPAVLVAKQAAEIDVLTRGRFRLGVGVGWNQLEFEALGADFASRGSLLEEQVDVMRALWVEEVVQRDRPSHRVRGAGLRPRPIQCPIPIWMGGGESERVLDRIGRLADGWFPQDEQPEGDFTDRWERIQSAARRAGRPSGAVGLEPRLETPGRSADELIALASGWEAAGASHLGCSTVGAGLPTLDAHLSELRRVSDILDLR